MSRHPVAILGASGYVGAETLRLVLAHPRLEVAALGAKRRAGEDPGALHPRFRGLGLPAFRDVDDIEPAGLDAVFCCLPHGTTQEVVARMAPATRVVDLSADFRLRSTDDYETWYGHPHRAPELQEEAVYGLTEHAREALAAARVVACPGCYPTAALLPLLPPLAAGMVAADSIVIDAKSGVSGAGRSLREDLLFGEVAEGVRAYGLAGHRHAPEIEQELGLRAGGEVRVAFVPHLVPMNRGILATVYVRLAGGADADGLRAALADAYAGEPFVQVLPEGEAPTTREVRGSNRAQIGVAPDRRPGHALLLCAIDNLLKGAAGQAVQNLNRMLGMPETEGLAAGPMVP